jgi:hypothetical protein
VNGTRATKTLSNNGRPFQTTAWSGRHFSNWMGAWYLDAGGEQQPQISLSNHHLTVAGHCCI